MKRSTSIRTSNMDDGEKNDILAFIRKGKSVQEAAIEFGRDASTIYDLLKQLRPTTDLARATLLAKAHELTARVMEKADVDQLIDLLSRPNIGVLEPNAKPGLGTGAPPVLINIQAGSLAAVSEVEFVDGQKRVNQPTLDTGNSTNIQIGPTPIGQLYKGE